MASSQRSERECLLDCIRLYKNLPALWDTKSELYRNERAKNLASSTLLQKYREHYPRATKADLRQKIDFLRMNYRNELRRLKEQGSNCESNVWYFDELSFLNEDEEITGSQSHDGTRRNPFLVDNVNNDYQMNTRFITTDNLDTISCSGNQTSNALNQRDLFGRSLVPAGNGNGTNGEYSGIAGRRMSLSNSNLSNNKTGNRRLQTTAAGFVCEADGDCNNDRYTDDDEHDNNLDGYDSCTSDSGEYLNLAKVWATELSKMNHHQQLYAKKGINDVIFEGQMGTLFRNSIQINDKGDPIGASQRKGEGRSKENDK